MLHSGRHLAPHPAQSTRPGSAGGYGGSDRQGHSPASSLRHQRACRRMAAGTVLLYALAVLVAGTTLRPGVAASLALGIPLPVPQGAFLLAAAMALLVAGASRGLLRGQNPAYRVVVTAMALSAAAHLVRGIDPTAAVLSLVVVGFLLVERDSFQARVGLRAAALRLLVLAFVVAVLIAATLIVSFISLKAIGDGRSFGVDAIIDGETLPTPFKIAAIIGLLALATAAGWALTAPDESVPTNTADDLAAARDVVRQFGADSLSYFALRDDKTHLIVEQGLVSYAVVDGYCLVAPDPIGPGGALAWERLRTFTARQGWPVAVPAVSLETADQLRAQGMAVVYTGDEAVVDVRGFHLDGQRRKSLRQAVNRMRRSGYSTSVCSADELSETTRAEVLGIAAATRRGTSERGFSMSLGRIADARDDVVLVVVRTAEDRVCAFCQFVPSPALNGWSLDVMRRDGFAHPNGLMELALIDFFSWVERTGGAKVSLNFAPFRSVLDGTVRVRPMLGLDRWLLGRIGASTQMASLYSFNAKFDPEWFPRYVAVDGPEYLLPAAIAWLRAEGISELSPLNRLAVWLRA
jgi:lysyl-tRNA synthetase class 2